jgi:prepilin-type processing-associated H-X9-DG protein
LLALFLPAIQRIRELASRLHCANNLRQLALAAHQYANDHHQFPPGYLGPLPNDLHFYDPPGPSNAFYVGQWIGHLPLLLPYLDHDPLFRSLDVDFDLRRAPVNRQWWLTAAGGYPHVANYTAAHQQLKLFQCPADAATAAAATTRGYHFRNDGGDILILSVWYEDYQLPPDLAARFRPFGRTNYAGIGGGGRGNSTQWSRFEGILCNRSRNTPAQVAAWDGTSHTLLYGETSGHRAWWGDGALTIENSWVGTGALTTAFGVQRGHDAFFDVLSSRHRTGVQFSMADGSVRLVRFDSPHDGSGPGRWILLMQLAGMRDGLADDLTWCLE